MTNMGMASVRKVHPLSCILFHLLLQESLIYNCISSSTGQWSLPITSV